MNPQDLAKGGLLKQPASGNSSPTPQTAATSTQPQGAGSTTTLSPPDEEATDTSGIPHNLTCDRKWGDGLADDQCYLNFAIGLGDVRICKNLTYKSLREICFYSIGIETKNLSACNMVEDDIKRKKCFDVVEQNE
jgi:hypothetical protein